MTGLRALRQLDLDHLHLIVRRHFGEFFGVERAFRRAAPKIAAPDLPDQIATVLAMEFRDGALPGRMRKTANFRTMIERFNRVG